jgi:hypothetical protein
MSSTIGGPLAAEGLGRMLVTGTSMALGTSLIAGSAALTGIKALQGKENTCAKVTRTFLQIVAFSSACTMTGVASMSTILGAYTILDNVELSLAAGAAVIVGSIYLGSKIYK